MTWWRVDAVLIACFAAVVAAFVGATVYTQHRTREIEGAALSIEGNAAPSIRRLAGAEAELRRLQLLVHRALVAGAPSNRTIEIESGRALLDAEVTAYRGLQLYPGEAAAWRRAESGLSRLDGDVSDILDDLSLGDRGAALAAEERLDAASEDVARALAVGIDTNVAGAAALAAQIGESRHLGAIWAVELDTVGVLLAILAVALALRISHARARAVEEVKQIAEEKAGELGAFATRMAHDIRNPLTAAKLAFEDVLRNESVGERARRSAARGSRAVSHAAQVVEALLEFARAGARPPPGATASPSEVAEEVAAVLRARAEQVGAELEVTARSHAQVACAPGMLASVLGNLVGNALTYVDGSPVRRVAVGVEEEGDQVKVSVSDTGPGLPDGVDPATLFKAYVRGPGARGRGLGLGLATVSRIVEAHRGRLGVDSTAAGCRFWFVLPRAGGAGAERRDPAAARP
jgi:signal transduction histidine kinase